jgi:SAM-dependent methyltransferase
MGAGFAGVVEETQAFTSQRVAGALGSTGHATGGINKVRNELLGSLLLRQGALYSQGWYGQIMRDSPSEVNARLVRSLRNHGFRHTVRAGIRHLLTFVSRLIDRHFDPAFGTETRRVVENAALEDVISPNQSRGIRYEPTRALPFRRVLRRAHIPASGGFVDLGCGKGRVLILAVQYGFAQVTGVDYSRALCSAAERNLGAFRARTKRTFMSKVLAMDAADYAFTKDDTVVYIFNPFDAVVLAAVIARLRRSLERNPRAVWVVYHNPVWRASIESTGAFAHVGDFSSGGSLFAVYRSRES